MKIYACFIYLQINEVISLGLSIKDIRSNLFESPPASSSFNTRVQGFRIQKLSFKSWNILKWKCVDYTGKRVEITQARELRLKFYVVFPGSKPY